jgi:RHS repeat-associated protein
LYSHLGSSALELDNNADVISYEEYHPFGTTAYQANNAALNAAAKRYRYTGMERDDETGLEYHSARYYISWLGRWLSADPIGIGDGLNVYGYCKGNPVNSVDINGKEEVSIFHRTTEAGATSIVSEGVRLDASRPHVWAGSGFYGSSSESIPSSIGSSGDVIVEQRISIDRIADLDAISTRPGIGNNIVSALQDTDELYEVKCIVKCMMQGTMLLELLEGIQMQNN